MANHPSADKRHRQNLKKRARNAVRRSKVHTAERKLQKAIQDKDATAIKGALTKAVSEIMQAKSKGILRHKTASRKVALVSRQAHRALGGSKAEPAS